MTILSEETAQRIYAAHCELAAARKLRADVSERLADKDRPPFDAREHPRYWRTGIEMGVPMDRHGSSKRMLAVEHELALKVIDAHIDAMIEELRQQSDKARDELSAMVAE